MQAITKTLLFTCAICTIAQGRVARAQPDQPQPNSTDTDKPNSDDKYSYAWSEKGMSSAIGVSTLLGGGVTSFTDSTARGRTSSAGGLWDLHVTIGSHIPLALDVNYLGSATNINGLVPGESGTLIGTTVEGALRYNILPHFAWNPYIFAGAGWQRYDITRNNFMPALNGLNNKDDLAEFPMGAGLSFRTGGFVADVRGTFRATTDQNLIVKTPTISPTSPTSNDFTPMHTWEASAALGYEF